MRNLWQRLLADETGVVLSSEIALVGTVGVLGMVVGLEAVCSAVNSELNDLASAFGTMDQTFNFRSISRPGHAFVRGAGFNDRGDFCDCVPLTSFDVFGKTAIGGVSEATGVSQSIVSQNAIVSPNAVVSPPPVVHEQVIEERVIEEVVEPVPVKAVCPDDEIIEEHIIRRRVRSDCSAPLSSDCATSSLKREHPPILKKHPVPKVGPKSIQGPPPPPPLKKSEPKKPKKSGE